MYPPPSTATLVAIPGFRIDGQTAPVSAERRRFDGDRTGHHHYVTQLGGVGIAEPESVTLHIVAFLRAIAELDDQLHWSSMRQPSRLASVIRTRNTVEVSNLLSTTSHATHMRATCEVRSPYGQCPTSSLVAA